MVESILGPSASPDMKGEFVERVMAPFNAKERLKAFGCFKQADLRKSHDRNDGNVLGKLSIIA